MGVRALLVTSTVVTTASLLVVVVVLPLFFTKLQRANTLMLAQLQNCHKDSSDIWRQLAHEKVRERRSYGGSSSPLALGKCCSCQQGKPGPPGPRGADGEPGHPGLLGLNGRNGINGRYVTAKESNEPACQKCPSAPPGPPGYPGSKGPRGPAGTPGTPGNEGVPGRDGPPGPAGVRGPPGEFGMQGPPGDSGKVLNGAPQGPPGKLGKVGPRGKAGQSGRDGHPGVEGIAGALGDQGERGSRGSRGPPGPPGPPGLSGHRGSCSHCPQGRKSPSQAPRAEAEFDGYDQQQPPAHRTQSSSANAESQSQTEVTGSQEGDSTYSDADNGPARPSQQQGKAPQASYPSDQSSNSPSQGQQYNQPQAESSQTSYPSEQTHGQSYDSRSNGQLNHQTNSYLDGDEPKTVNYPDTLPAPRKHSNDAVPADEYASGRQRHRQFGVASVDVDQQPFGYSDEQLVRFAAAPSGAAGDRRPPADSFLGGAPSRPVPSRAFQTRQGYNVHIVGSGRGADGGPSYGARPVGAWDAVPPRARAAPILQLSPPSSGPSYT